MFGWLRKLHASKGLKCTDDDSCSANFSDSTGRTRGDTYDVTDEVQPSHHGNRRGASGPPRGQGHPHRPCHTRAGVNDCALTQAMVDTLAQGKDRYDTSTVMYDRDHMERPLPPRRACPRGPGTEYAVVFVGESKRMRPSPYSDRRYMLNDGFYSCLYVHEDGTRSRTPQEGYVFNMRQPGAPVKWRPKAAKTVHYQQ